MAFFSKHANVHWMLAEGVVIRIARAIENMDPKEFLTQADQLVPRMCEMHGINQELSSDQYKQIAQASCILAYDGRKAYSQRRRDVFKNFKGL